MAFSPCGAFLATMTSLQGMGYKICLWATETGQCHVDQIFYREVEGSDVHTDSLALVCSSEKTWAGLFTSYRQDNEAVLNTSVPSRYVGKIRYASSILQATFTSDWLLLATIRLNSTVNLWDTVTGHCIGAINVRTNLPGLLSFQGPGLLLQMSPGALDLSNLVQPRGSRGEEECNLPPVIRGYGISGDRNWITREGKRFLWLPPACRRGSWDEFCISNSTVAICTEAGEVYFGHLPEGNQASYVL